MSVLSRLDALDRSLFALLNRAWTHPALDAVMPYVTDPHRVRLIVWFAAPLIAGWWLWRERRRGLRVLVLAALAVGASDLLCYRVLKPWAARPRPEYTTAAIVRSPVAGRNGMPSNHAANAAAAASVVGTAYPGARLLFWAMALLVAYSRVYCGAHFPADVLVGLLVGALIGLPWARLMLGKSEKPAGRKKRR